MKQFCEQIGLATRTLYFSTWSLFFKRDPILPPSKISSHKSSLLQGNALDDETYISQDREMDHNEHREKNELVDNIRDSIMQFLKPPFKKGKDSNGGNRGKQKRDF